MLVVAYVSMRRYGRKPRFLVAKDAESRDWTFVSGTCEPRETADKCAVRELWEETRGLVSIVRLPKRTKRFQTVYENNRVTVMFVPLRLSEEQMATIVSEFPETDSNGREEMDENTALRFETLAQFSRRKNVWSFVKELIGSEQFLSMCPGVVQQVQQVQ